MKIPWISSLVDYVVEWWRDYTGQSVSKYRVPDPREVRENELKREVQILRLEEEQERLQAERKRKFDDAG